MSTLLDRAMKWIQQQYNDRSPRSLGTECFLLMQEYERMQSAAADGPPGTNMDVQQEAARWRWARCIYAAPNTPEAATKNGMIAGALFLGKSVDQCIDDFIRAGLPTKEQIDFGSNFYSLANSPAAKPTMCDCDCHKAGVSVFHAVPCCDFTYQKRTTP